MKCNRIFSLLFILATTLPPVWGTPPTANKYFVLSNGLKVYLEEKTGIPLVHMGFGINVGSKDEEEQSGGLVHLLEHLILLGSSNLNSRDELVEKIRQKGLYFNGHTTHDLMTFAVSAPAEHADTALELLREKVFDLKPDPEEVEKEKKVILEELSQEEDDPVKLSIRLSLQALFSGHPYEKPVGGRKTTVENTGVERLKGFYNNYFSPSNCSIAVVGDFRIENMEKKVKEMFEHPEVSEVVRKDFKETVPPGKNVEIERELDITQAHLILGFTAPGTNHPDKLAVDVLTQILGEGVNPLLFAPLGGQRRLAESIKISYIPLTYGGAVLIHLVTDPRKINSAKTEVLRFLRELRSFKFSREDHQYRNDPWITDYLETAKTWMRFDYEQFREQGSNMALSYARYMLVHHSGEEDQKTYKELLREVRSSHLQKVAAEYFSGKRFVTVTIIPKKNEGKQ